ncbi:MAG TPA: cation-translocating P-type ATPase C-terminal domain-containing protein [Methanosarcina sp.]|nr:cation-translocating P-type ATPase C-terminal domain-containing protein [Methanosarcina sp.]
MGFVAFSLLSIVMDLSARSETATAFNRDILHDRNQLYLYGLALLVTILATELGLLQHILSLTSLSGKQWLICLAIAIALLLVDEVIKVFLRIHSRASPGISSNI